MHIDPTVFSPASPSGLLATFAARYPFEDIPSEVLGVFPSYVLDNCATMLAGCAQRIHRYSRDAMKVAFGPGSFEAVGGARLPFSAGVFLDGLAAADFEFEHVVANAHPSSAVFPALLALAAQRHCSGRELIGAMIVAYEVAARIGAASGSDVESERGFHNPGLNGTLACAAGCSRLLHLDPTTTASAMGIAASSSAGLLAFVDTGTMTKRLHPARSAQLGFESAVLAQAGVKGPLNVLENRYGFFHAFSPDPQLELLTVDLGRAWKGSRMVIKLSPVHAFAQPLVYAINRYRSTERPLKPTDIGSITIKVPSSIVNSLHWNLRPSSFDDAQYSVPFSVGVALARDLRNPLEMNESIVDDPEVSRLISRMRSEALVADPTQFGGTLLLDWRGEQVCIDGSAYPGFPGAPGYEAAITRKFKQVTESLKTVSDGIRLEEGIGRILALNDVADVRTALLRTARCHTAMA